MNDGRWSPREDFGMRRTSTKLQGKRVTGKVRASEATADAARRYTPAEIRRDRVWLTTLEFEAKHGRRAAELELAVV